MRPRRRALVLAGETRRHSFRQDILQAAVADTPPRRWRIGMQDLREFLMAYCACFLAVSVFIL